METVYISNHIKFYLLWPLSIVLFILVILSFYFRPFDVQRLSKPDAELEEDLDGQFKLGRTSCLGAGMTALYIFLRYSDPDSDIFIVVYIFLIMHMAMFVIYIFFRNFHEESLTNMAYFQMAFMTAFCVIYASYSAAHVNTRDGSLFYECKSEVQFTGTPKATEGEGEAPAPLPPDHVRKTNVDYCQQVNHSVIYSDLQDGYLSVNILSVQEVGRTVSVHAFMMMVFGIIWFIYDIFWVRQLSLVWRGSKLVVAETAPAG